MSFMTLSYLAVMRLVRDAGVSVQGRTVPEFEIPEDDWEDHIIEEPI